MVGAVVGLVLGTGVSLALLPRFISMQYDYFDYDLIISMVMHGMIWGLLGAAAGLAFATGLGEPHFRGPLLVGGLVGAVLGAITFDLIGAVFFTAAETDQPISETWPTRLLARLLVCLGTALLVVLLLPEPSPAGAAPQPETPPPGS